MALKDRKLRQRGHVDAEAVCRVLLELAVDHFAEAGKEELTAWNFESSQKLGQFIHELASQGGIELSDDDHLDDFDAWYDLTQDPKTWNLQW